MPFLMIASAAIGIITLLLSLLSQLALWQTKEYRWDRLWSHLKSPQGSLLNYPLVLLAIFSILVGWLSHLFPLIKWTEGISEFFGWLALLLFFLHHVFRIRKRGVLRPDFTAKAIAIIVGTLVLSLASYFALHTSELVSLQRATFIFFLPGFIGFTVWLINILFNFRKKQIISEAKRLRQAQTQLTVVGITGSYGKTSIKYFVSQILENAGRSFIATEAHHNTPIGVAQDMRSLLPAKSDIFVAELSAYRRGEIRELCDLIKPQIGIIAAIGNQHLDLFGSQENILITKWELIDALPKDGIAILNADDLHLKQRAGALSRHVMWYSTRHHADVWVEHVNVEPRRLTVTLHLKDFSYALTLPLASEALLSSALAAAATCLALKIEPEKIIAGLEKLLPFPRTMEIVAGKHGATIIDDSYSANEQGTLLAIRHLGRFREDDKRVVLLPLIELGQAAKNVHRRIGEAIRTSGARLYVAGQAYRGELGPGIHESDSKRLAEILTRDTSAQTVILLEGRLPDVVRRAVLS